MVAMLKPAARNWGRRQSCRDWRRPKCTSLFEENTMNDHITVEGHDGAFAAYIARPKTSPAPAVVVLQELFGVNADIRKTCAELAERGNVAVAPDLFWRQEPGVDLSN